MPGSCSSLRDLVLVVTAETQRTGRLKCHQEGEARTEGRHGQEGREMPAWGTGPGREPRAPSSRTRSPTDSGQTEPHASRRLEARGRPGSLCLCSSLLPARVQVHTRLRGPGWDPSPQRPLGSALWLQRCRDARWLVPGHRLESPTRGPAATMEREGPANGMFSSLETPFPSDEDQRLILTRF